MTTDEQINMRCAELDGWEKPERYPKALPNYTASYDAIIPLIQRQDKAAQKQFLNALFAHSWTGEDCDWFVLSATPAQLCEALLRATGKWKE